MYFTLPTNSTFLHNMMPVLSSVSAAAFQSMPNIIAAIKKLTELKGVRNSFPHIFIDHLP